MALIATVTKGTVNLISPGLYDVNMIMILTDNLVEVLNKNYSVRYCTGDVITNKISQFVNSMQIDINKYKVESYIYTSAVFTNAVTTVQNELVI